VVGNFCRLFCSVSFVLIVTFNVISVSLSHLVYFLFLRKKLNLKWCHLRREMLILKVECFKKSGQKISFILVKDNPVCLICK
jgi:hypothetical protein